MAENHSVETFDRLIDWDTSITDRDEFFDRVYGDDPLRIKFGADVTAPTLHIGHGVNLRVMREMQDLGHKVVFLLGGFTTLVGDPTDKLHTREISDLQGMEKNKSRFVEQIGSILNMDEPDLIEVRDNTEWWGGVERPGTISQLDFFRLLGDVTLNQLLARDMFKKRQEAGQPIRMSEFLYPVLQGYDSVMMESDATVVGSDQLFNESMGRYFQDRAGQDSQMVLCTRITPGLDGGPKQSKSVGNFVGISHSPNEKFDRLMRLRDDLTVEWLEVYSSFSLEEIRDMQEEFEDQPLEFKKRLAHNVTAMFHGEEAALQAEHEFAKKIQRRLPSEIDELIVDPNDSLRSVLMSLGYKSGAIRQFVESGSIQRVDIIDNEGDYTNSGLTYEDITNAVQGGTVIKIGKNKFYRVSVDDSSN